MTELPDRLLRDALRPDALETPSKDCVDAGALAAWAEGTMSRADRTAFEIHAADCARCQALMAAMARTEPPGIERAWFRRAPFSWLMPLAAATAAIVIGVSLAMPERRGTAPAAFAPTESARTASAPVASAPRAAAPPEASAPTASAPTASAPAASARRESARAAS